MKVLFVDDEADLWIELKRRLNQYDLEIIEERLPELVCTRIEKDKPDVVLLDVMFPGPDGRLEPKGRSISATIFERYPHTPVVMFTSTLADARSVIDEGDFPYARYLFSKDRLADSSAADPYAELAQQLLEAIRPADESTSYERLGFVVGQTQQMKRVADSIVRVADVCSTVLIRGETGTGKELVARALHRIGDRSHGMFVAINCGGLTDEVLESALFGHERGAFTGAERQHRGFFEQAHEGTLFLDEVDAMSSALQDKVLRVLEDGVVRRMGSQKEVHVDVRSIAATNKNLFQIVKDGRFRQDLYYRMCVIEIELPPLRQRLEDLPILFRTLMRKLNERLRKNVGIEPRQDVLEKLRGHPWPGNIRELEHVLERAMIATRANVLTPSAIKFGTIADAEERSPTFALVHQILSKRLGWEGLKDVHGETRRVVLEELINAIAAQQQQVPSSSQMAKLLGVTEGNMRRILSEAGVHLRRKILGRS
jgi:DNA-binding NtrC family response regulator